MEYSVPSEEAQVSSKDAAHNDIIGKWTSDIYHTLIEIFGVDGTRALWFWSKMHFLLMMVFFAGTCNEIKWLSFPEPVLMNFLYLFPVFPLLLVWLVYCLQPLYAKLGHPRLGMFFAIYLWVLFMSDATCHFKYNWDKESSTFLNLKIFDAITFFMVLIPFALVPFVILHGLPHAPLSPYSIPLHLIFTIYIGLFFAFPYPCDDCFFYTKYMITTPADGYHSYVSPFNLAHGTVHFLGYCVVYPLQFLDAKHRVAELTKGVSK